MTTLDERIRLMVADEVATAPDAPAVEEILSRAGVSPLPVDAADAGRSGRVVILGAALAAAASLVAGLLVVRQVAQTTETSAVTTSAPAVTVARPPHLLPDHPPSGLVLASAEDVMTLEPFGAPVTTQVFTRSDGAFLRLAVDPWREGRGRSPAPLGLEGFETVMVRGQDGGWRNQTLGYGMLWFRVGATDSTRVVAQTSGLSASEAVALADELMVRGDEAAAGFSAPAGGYRLSVEVLAADGDESWGSRSEVTWVDAGGAPARLSLVTMVGDAREAWRLLLDGSGQLVQIGSRTVLEASAAGRSRITWIEDGTVYRLEGTGASATHLTEVLRSLRTVDEPAWLDAVAAAHAEMASWTAAESGVVGEARLSIHRRSDAGPTSLCVSLSGGPPRCALSETGVTPATASVLVDGTWWLVGVASAEHPQATVLPDRGRAVVSGALGDGCWWFTSRLSNDATWVTYADGGATGTSGTHSRPLS